MDDLSLGWILYLVSLLIAFVILILYKFHKKRSPAPSKTFEPDQNRLSVEINLHPQETLTHRFLKWILLTTFLLFAFAGQFNFLNFPEGEQKGIIFYSLAILVLGILIWYMRDKSASKNSVQEFDDLQQRPFEFSGIKHIIQNKSRKFILFCLSIFLSILSLLLLINRPAQNSHWDIFILWACSFLCYAFAFIGKPNFDFPKWLKQHKVDLFFILLFTLIGGIFRFYQLGISPNIVDGDEGRFGLMINDILEGRITNMFSTLLGNSSMYFFFLAGMMKLFGNNITILRIGSAIGGTLTIPILYLMANELFNRQTAIFATTVLVVSNFHIHFSHIMSVTSIQDGFFATSSLYLLYTGLRNKSPARMTLCGLVLGFALYIYMGARLIILLIPVYLLILFLLHPIIIKQNYINILIFAGAFIIITLPMIYWAMTNPELFNIRAYQVGSFQSGWLAEEAVLAGQTQLQFFGEMFKRAFLTTIYYPSHGFHFSSWPMLDLFSSIFFVAGLVYALLHTKDPRYLLLNGWFWSGILVGGALVILPWLNSYRILIVFPVMCLYAGIGMDQLLTFMGENSKINRFVFYTIMFSFITLISIFNFRKYFIFYAPQCKYEEFGTRSASLIAAYASGLDQDVQFYLLTAPELRSFTHPSMSYLSPGRKYNEFVDPLTAPADNLDLESAYAFFFTPARIDELQWIQVHLPDGTVEQIYDCKVPIITVYLWIP